MRGWPPPTRPRWLAEANGLDFDDMLLAAVRTLHEHPETRHAAGERFPRILIDEHQDTNLPQYVLVRHCPKTARRLRGRGPQLGHLRLARSRDAAHHELPARLPESAPRRKPHGVGWMARSPSGSERTQR